MTAPDVVVLDYGSGNLRSAQRALERVGADVTVSSSATAACEADGLMVPAFVGLGAPHWQPDARGLICGLTLDVNRAHIVRAALESVAFQTLDLTTAMATEGARRAQAMRVDGGMVVNDWLCQFLADIIEAPVERPVELETTALGAAFLAGLACGVWPDLKALTATSATASVFRPRMAASSRDKLLQGWRAALRRVLVS